MRVRRRCVRSLAALVAMLSIVLGGCRPATDDELGVVPRTIGDVPAARLAFRLEPDVKEDALPQSLRAETATPPELLPGIKAHFETQRGNTEALLRTVLDPTGQRALAVYGTNETDTDFRIDLYSADGTFIRNILPPDLTGVFPAEVAWSPDGQHILFSGIRNPALAPQGQPTPQPAAPTAPDPTAIDPNAPPLPTPTAAPLIPSVPVFRTEQVYVGDRDGFNLRPLTTREGLIYFKLAWSPGGRAIAALATKEEEWQARRAEALLPAGRPRLITLEGQERLLDDRATPVGPVWSPDGSKVATAYDYDVAVYDVEGGAPTGGSLPLQDPLRRASAAYDARVFSANSAPSPAAPAGNATATVSPEASPTPGEPVLISFNPVVRLEWTEPDKIYAQTAFVRMYRDEAIPTFKYARWHLVMLYPQAVVLES